MTTRTTHPTPPPSPTHPEGPELLLPAGTPAHLTTALDFGADAVYVGHPVYSLRERFKAFGPSAMAEGLALAHRRGKKMYVTCNLLPHHALARTFVADLTPLMTLRPDGIVLADPGLITTALEQMHRGLWPEVPIHLSAQANTTNHASVKFWQRMGVRRVILSRELGLDEIEAIRQACPDIELEVLVHGALCIAYSGRALLSGYFNRVAPPRDAGLATDAAPSNDTPAARLAPGFNFDHEAQEAEQSGASTCGGTGRHPAADAIYLLEEAERPGQWMPIMEDAHGTYIMNSKDLRAVEHVARLVAMGVDALKIEGRTRSRAYVARTAQVYRRAIDAARAGEPFDPAWRAQLDGLSPGGHTGGFLERRPQRDSEVNEAANAPAPLHVGDVLAPDNGGWVVAALHPVDVGDRLELLRPQGPLWVTVTQQKPWAAPAPALDQAADTPRVWVALDTGAPGDEPHLAGALMLRHTGV